MGEPGPGLRRVKAQFTIKGSDVTYTQTFILEDGETDESDIPQMIATKYSVVKSKNDVTVKRTWKA